MAALFHLGAKWGHVCDELNDTASCLPVTADQYLSSVELN
jgi:hypothetical protein